MVSSMVKAAMVAVGVWSTSTCAQGADFSIPSKYTTWDNENWALSTNELIQGQFQSRMNLANGYLGLGLAAAGPFFEADRNLTDPNGELPINGWPLDNPRQTFCSIAGFWDSQPNTTRTNFPWLLQYGGESVISGVPHWAAIVFEFGGAFLDATVDNSTISGFTSSLSAKEGLAKWSYTWTPNESSTQFNVSYTLLISRRRPNAAAIQADITPSADANGTVTDILDGRSAVRSVFVNRSMDDTSIYTSVSPHGLSNITAFIVSSANFTQSTVNQTSRRQALASEFVSGNDSTIAQTWDINLKANETTTLFKFIGGASNDAFNDPEAVARNASSSGVSAGWDALLAEHTAAWAEILPIDSIDDYADSAGTLPDDPNIQDLQIISVMTPFYLLQNTLPDGSGTGLDDNSISVGGIAEDPYAGLVFWDADLFMSPGLVASHPSYARTIANYRVARSGQARNNALGNGYSNNSILFPWTSARFGNCTATGPCTDYQYHLNSDIAVMLHQHRNITGDEEWWKNEAWPIYEAVAYMYSELLKYNSTTQKWDVFNMTDPVGPGLQRLTHF
jgi:trehalose/maltose hydrolase-like predicted phosphorylase